MSSRKTSAISKPKTPFQRFDALVHTILRAPHQPKPAPKSPRKPSR
ncbi:MAG TPA: hypothetical protein VN515_07705 [Terriglobales bacterium]|nr:hypothetical protein [Terriglobales bacterium]